MGLGCWVLPLALRGASHLSKKVVASNSKHSLPCSFRGTEFWEQLCWEHPAQDPLSVLLWAGGLGSGVPHAAAGGGFWLYITCAESAISSEGQWNPREGHHCRSAATARSLSIWKVFIEPLPGAQQHSDCLNPTGAALPQPVPSLVEETEYKYK